MDNAKHLHINRIGKFLSGEINARERTALMAWVEEDPANRKFFEDAVKLWEVSGAFSDQPFETDTRAAWARLESRIDSFVGTGGPSSAPSRRLSISPWWLRAAAVILLVLGVGYWWSNLTDSSSMVAQTGAGEKRELVLPDGSQVWLNENSRLSYLEKDDQRRVTLEGEAFFEVKHMDTSPFVIATGEARTTVLGTSFNVRAYPEEDAVKVTVATGTVELKNAEDVASAIRLPAGTSGVLNLKVNARPEKTPVDVNATAWKIRRLQFDNTELGEVFSAIEDYYGIHVKLENQAINHCHFNGTYDQPQLNHLIEVIGISLDLDLSIQGDTLTVRGEGCQ